VGYAKKLASSPANPRAGTRPITVIGKDSGTVPSRVVTAPATPPAMRGPTVAAAAAQSRVDNKFVVVYPPDLHNAQPPPAPAYPANSVIMSGHQNNNHYAAAQPNAEGRTPLPPLPASTGSGASANSGYYWGRPENHDHQYGEMNHVNASQPQPSSAPVLPNNYVPPQSYNSQSAILTPSHYNANPAPAQSYQAPVYYGSGAPAQNYHSAPVYTPPSYQHAESAPAQSYHAPESHSAPAPAPSYHSAPAETHYSAPAPVSQSSSSSSQSSSSSSSSSSGSGHR
jgi:hypothetical protein